MRIEKRMFGRLPRLVLGLAAALALVLGLCPAVALAGEVEVEGDGGPVSVAQGGEAADGVELTTQSTTHVHDEVTFLEWNDTRAKDQNGPEATAGTSLPSIAGSYYLTADVTLPQNDPYWNVPPHAPVNLCLNGHKITGGSDQYHVIMVPERATLNLYDCGEGPTGITGGTLGVQVIEGTLNMHGGAITGNGGGKYGYGGVQVVGGTLTMDGGKISGNKSSYQGGGVYVFFGTFAMSGGEISGNEIVGNNDGAAGAGAFIKGSTFELSGSPTIAGNKLGGAASNVHLDNQSKIVITDALSNATPIGVTMEEPPGVFTTGSTDQLKASDYKANFTSDDDTYAVGTQGDELMLALVIKATATGYAGTYDGRAHGIAVSVTKPEAGYTVTYGESEDSCTGSKSPEYANAGEYTVWYKVTADGYADKVGSATVSIAKAASAVTKAPEGKRLAHTGSAQELVTAGAGEGGTMQYSLDGREYSAAIPKATEAGEYTVWYRVKGDGNHLDSDPQKVTSTIEKKDEPVTVPDASVTAHVQRIGWMDPVTDGTAAGTTGKSRRMEALTLKLPDGVAGGIEYRGHVQRSGWEKDWKADGAQSGTTGKSRRVEAVQVRLTGEAKDAYDVYYRVHVQRYGWMGWAKNGEQAGTQGMSRRAEAIQVVLVKKDAPAPDATYKGVTQQYAKAFVKK